MATICHTNKASKGALEVQKEEGISVEVNSRGGHNLTEVSRKQQTLTRSASGLRAIGTISCCSDGNFTESDLQMGLSTGYSPTLHISSEADPNEKTFTVTQHQMSRVSYLKIRNWVIPAVIFI